MLSVIRGVTLARSVVLSAWSGVRVVWMIILKTRFRQETIFQRRIVSEYFYATTTRRTVIVPLHQHELCTTLNTPCPMVSRPQDEWNTRPMLRMLKNDDLPTREAEGPLRGRAPLLQPERTKSPDTKWVHDYSRSSS